MKFKNFFSSGWDFEDIKSQYQMLNAGLLLSTFSLFFGIVSNCMRGDYYLIKIEVVLILANLLMLFILRKDRKYFNYVAHLLTAQFSALFLYLMYMSDPSLMKHVWLFSYPIIILYFIKSRTALIWIVLLFSMIVIGPFQTFVEMQYSLHQIIYILFVVAIVSSIMFYYKMKISQTHELVIDFNKELEKQVKEKTIELRDINESLEGLVQEKIDELIQKDKLLTVQSKQAVMGEMISMIAHQWRQPLSNITLQISNLKLRKMLSNDVSDEEVEKTLDAISDSVVYLADTVDDFKTYFHQDREMSRIEMHELLQKAINFTLPRLKGNAITIDMQKTHTIEMNVYANELLQVVMNILNNAIDVLLDSSKGEKKITIVTEDTSSDLLIRISNNGPMIEGENIDKIFEPYFSTKGKNGTGIGLYMSQMIMQKQFNGQIEVSSSEEMTTFQIIIPKDI